MEHTILSILLAISLYNIDYISNNGSIWLLLYIIFGVLYIILFNKIDKSLNIRKNILTKINNFLFHISFVVGLLIIIYGFNWASLWEWRILHYDLIQYLVFIVFMFPVFLWFKIFITRSYFKDTKNTGILSLIYLVSPTYFWNFKKNIPINLDMENFSKADKVKLAIAVIFVISIILYMAYFMLNLFILSQERNNPVNYEIRSNGEGNIEYIDYKK